MPTYAELQVAPPKSWDEFESIVCSAAKNRWASADFVRHGRQGQRQDGVDVYGKDDKGRLVGLQCKNTWAGLTADSVIEEVEKAESFNPPLLHLYVVTTAATDKNLQALVREVSEARETEGRFGVSILFWPDVWQDLTLNEERLFQHYPQLRPKEERAAEPSHDVLLFQELQAVFGFEPAVRLIREQNFGDSFRRKAIQPLFDFVETWDQPEKEFLDPELNAALKGLYAAANDLATQIVQRTVPIGKDGHFASVYSDSMRTQGPRPDSVREDARILNETARQFVPIYEGFLRLCKAKLLK